MKYLLLILLFPFAVSAQDTTFNRRFLELSTRVDKGGRELRAFGREYTDGIVAVLAGAAVAGFSASVNSMPGVYAGCGLSAIGGIISVLANHHIAKAGKYFRGPGFNLPVPARRKDQSYVKDDDD